METIDEEDNEDLYVSIKAAVKDARARLHQTMDKYDPTIHRAHVCIVCDCFIQSCKSVRKMYMTQLKKHKHRIGTDEYEKYHNV